MSFILDALKRSDRARRVLGAGANPPPPERVAAPRRTWTVVAVSVLLLGNGALLAWALLRDAPEAAPAPIADTAPVLRDAGQPAEGVRPLAREVGAAPLADAAPDAGADGPQTERSAPIGGATGGAASALPLADAGPTLRLKLDALHLDAHGWSEDPAQRFVLVNLKRRVVGDALAPGVTLLEIVPEGAVVEVDGVRVLLPRQ